MSAVCRKMNVGQCSFDQQSIFKGENLSVYCFMWRDDLLHLKTGDCNELQSCHIGDFSRVAICSASLVPTFVSSRLLLQASVHR